MNNYEYIIQKLQGYKSEKQKCDQKAYRHIMVALELVDVSQLDLNNIVLESSGVLKELIRALYEGSDDRVGTLRGYAHNKVDGLATWRGQKCRHADAINELLDFYQQVYAEMTLSSSQKERRNFFGGGGFNYKEELGRDVLSWVYGTEKANELMEGGGDLGSNSDEDDEYYDKWYGYRDQDQDGYGSDNSSRSSFSFASFDDQRSEVNSVVAIELAERFFKDFYQQTPSAKAMLNYHPDKGGSDFESSLAAIHLEKSREEIKLDKHTLACQIESTPGFKEFEQMKLSAEGAVPGLESILQG